MVTGHSVHIPCLDHLEEGANRGHPGDNVCSSRERIGNGDNGPRKSQKVLKGAEKVSPRAIVPS